LKTSIISFTLIVLSFWGSSCSDLEKSQDGIVVNNIEEFSTAIAAAKPGDRIVLANGTWMDTELKFAASGTEESPIYIVAEEKGKVFFEGQSNIKMGGEYLHLEGVVFRNGFTPTSSCLLYTSPSPRD